MILSDSSFWTTAKFSFEQAIQSLDDSWTRAHEERIQAWDQEVLEEPNAAEEAQRLQQEQQALEHEPLGNRKEEIQNERLREETVMVGSYIVPRSSQYSLRRLKTLNISSFSISHRRLRWLPPLDMPNNIHISNNTSISYNPLYTL